MIFGYGYKVAGFLIPVGAVCSFLICTFIDENFIFDDEYFDRPVNNAPINLGDFTSVGAEDVETSASLKPSEKATDTEIKL